MRDITGSLPPLMYPFNTVPNTPWVIRAHCDFISAHFLEVLAPQFGKTIVIQDVEKTRESTFFVGVFL